MSRPEGEAGSRRLIGYNVDLSGGDGRARCWLDVAEAHANRRGILHGGIATTLLDTAMGSTAGLVPGEARSTPVSTVSLTIQFLAPGRVGTRLTATGNVTGGGRSLKFVEGELRDEEGTLIASATGVFKSMTRDA
ncbi:uncharacterized domain 1-containing protein [Tranquillimonas rosea]|uniref:Uncharacterized domain 1-containing protein n=1 Tax=Tranquillimonas rosea TaxID=641238 RepID=A0A1H9WY62_9RHOB|nr:PaaI family thioesterase [Tranquillimonas rosea]SES38795.1 uncharacterized domain 1-containing protein [Tranquillimonas rosea]